MQTGQTVLPMAQNNVIQFANNDHVFTMIRTTKFQKVEREGGDV